MNNPYDQNPINNEPINQPEQPKFEQTATPTDNANQGYSNTYSSNNQNGYGHQYSQNNQYGYQRPQYTGYYGNAGYYGQQAPQSPYMQANRPQVQIQRPEKKRASKGFVIGMVAIGIVISFLLNACLCFIMNLPTGGMNFFSAGKVILQYTPKEENTAPITDKGVSAYVASVAANTVVEVITETVETDGYYGQYIIEGAGSGIIISSTEEGSYILTCAHVIDGASKITVKLKDGTEYTADSCIGDIESDVGIIKLNVKGLPVATIGDFSKAVVGEPIVVIGNPLGTLGGSVTNGIISALDRDIIIDGMTYHLFQTNAQINPGNSGGGLFNAEGHLIGIVNAKSSGENVEGLGFAIPIDDAQIIMKDLLEKGYVTGRVKLGFSLLEIQSKEDAMNHLQYYRYFTEFGVYIIESENPNFQTGDLLVAIDTEKISTITDLKALLQKLEVGQTITITVSRITGTNKVQLFDIELTLQEKKS